MHIGYINFINHNYVSESEDIVEDDYFAVEYAKYFIEKRKHEDMLKQKYQEEKMKKDQIEIAEELRGSKEE